MSEINTYHRPQTIDEALSLLSKGTASSTLLAGGTSVVAAQNVHEAIDLQDLGLNGLSVDNQEVRLGAMVTIQQIVDTDALHPFLREIAQRETTNTFRNAATVGGVIATAASESMLYAAFLAFNGQVTLVTPAGEVTEPLAALNLSNYPAAIIADIVLEPAGTCTQQHVARTPADDPIVAVVGRRTSEGSMKMVACGVDKRPIVLEEADVDGVTPAGDFRGSSSYRQAMCRLLFDRVKTTLASGG